MKTIASLLLTACLLAGCVTGGNISHEESQSPDKQDGGPVLCRDGSTPPCNTRS
jgi:PBP1b-binding outer membrane lipoprotein LpoB